MLNRLVSFSQSVTLVSWLMNMFLLILNLFRRVEGLQTGRTPVSASSNLIAEQQQSTAEEQHDVIR